MKPYYLLLALGCSSGPTGIDPPAEARSADFRFEPIGGHIGYDEIHSWVDSTRFRVQLDGRAVRGVIVHWRVTLGAVRPLVDTTDAEGRTFYKWGIGLDQQQGLGEVFGCVLIQGECVEQRHSGIRFSGGG